MKRFPDGVKIEAQGANLLLELLGKDAKTPGGLLLPGNQKDMHREGIIRSIGPTVAYQDAQQNILAVDQLNLGDRVLIGHAGDEFTIGGVVYILVNRAAVFARIHNYPEGAPAHEVEEDTIPEATIEREPVAGANQPGKIHIPGM